METQFSDNQANKNLSNWIFWLVGLALLSGLILSILSWIELCVEHCSANQDYVLFGIPFAPIGVIFFSFLLILQMASCRYAFVSQLRSWMIAIALGAEIMFIAVQKYEIGQWCPVCLSIAVSIAVAACLLFIGFNANLKNSLQLHNRGIFMENLKGVFSSLAFIIGGFLMAFIGISNPNSAEAVAASMKERLAFGDKDSPIEIYFVTDWYCPACKKIEPLVEKQFPFLQAHSAFFFIDYPVHKKSMNFSPYNLAFMINNKSNYFEGRQLLRSIAEKTDSPKDKNVAKAAKKKGIVFKELSFVDIKSGMEFFDKIVEEYKLHSTPILIFVNRTSKQVIKLDGSDEITEGKIDAAFKKIKLDGKDETAEEKSEEAEKNIKLDDKSETTEEKVRDHIKIIDGS